MSGISYKAWVQPSPRAALLLIHGLGSNSTWWEAFGNYSTGNNLSSYAIDLRIQGSFESFYGVIRELLKIVKKDNPGKKIFAVGESMGALIILSMALKDPDIYDGLICMSPAFKSKAPLKILDYFKIFLPLFYKPESRHPLPVTPDMCTRDPKYLKVIRDTYDKDVMQTSRVLVDIFISQLRMRLLKMRLAMPVLFLVAGNDKLVYSEVSEKVFKSIEAGHKEIIRYPDMYHSLSIDIGKEKVFGDIVRWINSRLA